MIEQQKDCVRNMKWCDFVMNTTHIMTQSFCGVFNWNGGRVPLYRWKEE